MAAHYYSERLRVKQCHGDGSSALKSSVGRKKDNGTVPVI